MIWGRGCTNQSTLKAGLPALRLFAAVSNSVMAVVKAPVAAHPTLKSGSTRSAVKTAQADLNNFHYGLKVDGAFGPATRAAVVAFQKSHGLVADGIIGPATWAKLAPAASVQPVAALTYTVWAGDTLGAIAVCYGTTWQHLASTNSISNPNLIKVAKF